MTLSRELQQLLRHEAGTFRAGERRRRFDPTVCVGVVGGRCASVVVPARSSEYVDRQVRPDLFAALLENAPADTDSAWVRRAGQTVTTADDVAWLVAAEHAFAAADRPLSGCYVITRYGWVDLRTGEKRVWKRLRLDR